MNTLIDNLIAYRVLSMLVQPFVESDAYKLGIIDDKGKNLIKSSQLRTTEQKNAYSYLHKLVFNLKKLLIKLPGGDAKLKNLIAALILIRESYENKTTQINENKLLHILNLIDEGVVFVEERLLIEKFLHEEGIANVTGSGVSIPNENNLNPVIRKKDKEKLCILRRNNIVNP